MSLLPTLDDPRLLPLLPAIYVAWADGELSAQEMKALCQRVAEIDGIDEDCTVALGRWLDADAPPRPEELAGLLAAIRRLAAQLDHPERLDLATFAAELVHGARPNAPLRAPEARAIAQIESMLGVIGPEETRAMLGVRSDSPATEELLAAFDQHALGAYLDGPRGDIRNRMRRLLTQPRFHYRTDISRDDYREVVLAWTQEIAERGIGPIGLPTEYGGEGSMSCFIGAFTILGHHDLSLLTKVGVQFGLFAGSIARLGTEHHHDAYLQAAGSGELLGCFAMTETDHGSNVRDLETLAVFNGATDEFVITTPHDGARKDYIGNAAKHGRAAIVFARLVVGGEDHGVHAFYVPLRDHAGATLPGVRIEDCGPKIGLEGVDNGRIWFAGVRVPRTALLDRFASVAADGTYSSDIPSPGRRFFTTIGTLVGGRVSVGAASISVAKSALTIAIRYATRRRQFGEGERETLILDYPTHQRRLMPRLAATYAYHFAFERLIDDYVSGEVEPQLIEAQAAGLKAYGSWHAIDTVQACREACGGAGYLAENRFGALRADADVFTTYEGDNTVLAQLVTKSLLSDYRLQFADMNLVGTIRFLAGKALASLREAAPTLGGADEDHLRDRQWHLDLFKWRSDHQVAALAARIKKRLDQGSESAAAFTAVQDHVLACARAHVEYLVLDRFASAIAANEDAEQRAMLDLLCDLFVLTRIEHDRGWFLEHGQISAAASKAIRKLAIRLSGEARQQARPLVESFLIPDAVLAAPIAR